MSRITALAAVLVLVLAGCSDSDMAVEPRESPQTRESPRVAMGLDDVNMIRSATPIPKLNVYISGPTEVSEPGLYTFTAVAPDDDGTWEYMWDIDAVTWRPPGWRHLDRGPADPTDRRHRVADHAPAARYGRRRPGARHTSVSP